MSENKLEIKDRQVDWLLSVMFELACVNAVVT